MTVPAAPRPPERDRPRFTSRAAVLAVVLCAIALSLAYPVREYIGQRRQIDQLTAQRATAEAAVRRLQAEDKQADQPGLRRAAGQGPAAHVHAGPDLLRGHPGQEAPGRRGPRPGATSRRGTRSCGDRSGPRTRPPPRDRRQRTSPPWPPSWAANRAACCGIAHRCPCGLPDVVETAPRLPDGTPFPTLFYLTCPRATAAMSRLEADGLMREMTARLGTDSELRSAQISAHQGYAALRASCRGSGRCGPASRGLADRRRHARPGQVPARAGRPRARRPGQQPARRRGAGGRRAVVGARPVRAARMSRRAARPARPGAGRGHRLRDQLPAAAGRRRRHRAAPAGRRRPPDGDRPARPGRGRDRPAGPGRARPHPAHARRVRGDHPPAAARPRSAWSPPAPPATPPTRPSSSPP